MTLDASKIGQVVAEQMEALESRFGDDCQIGDVCTIVEVVGPHGSQIAMRPSGDTRPHSLRRWRSAAWRRVLRTTTEVAPAAKRAGTERNVAAAPQCATYRTWPLPSTSLTVNGYRLRLIVASHVKTNPACWSTSAGQVTVERRCLSLAIDARMALSTFAMFSTTSCMGAGGLRSGAPRPVRDVAPFGRKTPQGWAYTEIDHM